MAYVIYHKETTLCWPEKTSRYASERAAKGQLTKAANEGKLKGEKDEYAVAEISEFRDNIEKQVERVNIMSGKKFMEPVNTPYYCSPSSETYWSM